MKSGKHKPKGEPKWDWIIGFVIPLNFKKVKLKTMKVGREFLKRILKQLKIKS
jgi:hypothetical protein